MMGFGPAALKSEGDAMQGYDENAEVTKPSTWLQLLLAAIAEYEPEWHVEHSNPSLLDFPAVSDDTDQKNAWTYWSGARVYFPAGYDGTFWVASVPRHPSNEMTRLVGGGC